MKLKRLGKSLLESSVDIDFESEVKGTNSYEELEDRMSDIIDKFKEDLKKEIGYEEGDTDKDRAIEIAIQDAVGYSL